MGPSHPTHPEAPSAPQASGPQTIYEMERSWSGTRVFYWGSDSQIRYGTVLESTRMKDGTQVFNIKPDTGSAVTLPAAGVTIVPSTPSAPQRV